MKGGQNMYSKKMILRIGLLLVAALLSITGGLCSAADITKNLVAHATTVTMPDGAVITMWGFGEGTDNTAPITVPGPSIALAAGDNLIINLKNYLPVPVSMIINGQTTAAPMTPVWTDLNDTVVGTGSRPAGNYTARVRSFTTETPADNGATTITYRWNNVKAGTYLYASGTNPAVQVQMGLCGAVTIDAALNNVYNNPASAYNQEMVMLFSEVDPVIHNAVATNNYGAGKAVSSMLHYEPKYFLINGKAYPAIPAFTGGQVGNKILLRILNGGGKPHVPFLPNGQYMTIVAEDGNPYQYTRKQYSLELPAGKTIDAIITPAATGNIPLFDRALKLNNAGVSPGGMIAFLGVTQNNLADAIRALVREYYLDILDREPDQAGWDYWTNEILHIMSLGINVGEGFQALARFYFNSPEYLLLAKDDTAFLTDVYETFLQRPPDQAGLTFWLNQLNAGLTRGMVITQFAYSDEFKTYMTSIFGPDTTRPENNMLNDFYRGILNVFPDDTGFNFWLVLMRTSQCLNDPLSLRNLCQDIALSFVQSPQYQARNRTDVEYLEDLYNAILRRGADAAGFQFWVNELTGGMTREQVLQLFTASLEFQTRVNTVIAAGCLQ
jgi:FtsP/CotA-like multicopper oxidase with cupredoxin domain